MIYFIFKKQHYRCIYVYFILFAGLTSIQWFQPSNPATKIQALTHNIDSANNLWAIHPQQAIALIEKTNKEAKQLVQDTSIAKIYHKIGVFYRGNMRDFSKALTFFSSGLTIREHMLDSLDKDLIRSLIMVGTTNRDLQRFQMAQYYLENALKKYYKNPEPKVFPVLALNVGGVYQATGQYEKAFTLYTKLNDFLISDSVYTPEKPKTFNSLGLYYHKTGKYNLAIDNYSKGLKIVETLDANNNYLKATFHTNIGICYKDSNRLDIALDYINLSIKTQDSIHNKNPENFRSIADAHLERAHCYNILNRLSEATKDYNFAIQILKTIGFLGKPFLSEAYLGLGNMDFSQGNLTAALANYHKAVGVLVPDFTKVTPLATPSVSEPIAAPIEAIIALEAKAKALYALRKNASYRVAARANYRLLDSLVMNLNSQYRDDGSKFDLIGRSVSIYEKALSLAIEARDTAAALLYLDRTKALVLREGLKDRSAKAIAGIPANIIAKENDLQTDIAFWFKQVVAANTDSLRVIYRDSLYESKRQLEDFVNTILTKTDKGKELAQLKYDFAKKPPLSINDIKSRLKDSMAVVEYFLGNDSIYKMTVSKSTALFEALALPKGFKDSVALFRQAMTTDANLEERKRNFERLSPQFYKWLLATPLSKINTQNTIRRLRIIPDGVLGYLPFSLLLEKENSLWTGNESEQPPFLIQRYAISYDYSRELMFDSTLFHLVKETGDNHRFGGLGIQYDDNTLSLMKNINKSLLPLPKSPLEVKAIHAQIGGDMFTDDAGFWSRRNTHKKAFAERMKEYSLLHLSMHASADDQDPLNSALIFSKRDASDDNLLTAAEIYAYDFSHNDLTVLSACNTASGTLRRGEGIMSLARAIAFAGCKSMVATLWSVGDNDMYTIMPAFYGNLKQGMDKDVALQAAQKTYLSTNFRDPNHWAAPILVGNIDGIKLDNAPSNAPYWIVLGVFLSASLLFFWFRWRKRGSLSS
jgi:CHAT domain-containing protein